MLLFQEYVYAFAGGGKIGEIPKCGVLIAQPGYSIGLQGGADDAQSSLFILTKSTLAMFSFENLSQGMKNCCNFCQYKVYS
jgi:hypothetical protein